MQNPASRIARHLEAIREFNGSVSMMNNFKSYFKADSGFEVVYCLHLINKELDKIEKLLKQKNKKTIYISRARNIFKYECLANSYNNVKNTNTQELADIFDSYSFIFKDEKIEDFKKIEDEAKELAKKIEDETLKDIINDIIKAIELYPCAGKSAFLDKIVSAVGKLALYIKTIGENETIKQISTLIERAYKAINIYKEIEELGLDQLLLEHF